MKLYQIQKDETICSIAKKFDVTCEQIINLNQITNQDFLKEGDIIRIK